MTDNLFDRLADLLRSPGPVNWRLAREIAESVAGPPEPLEPALVDEYGEIGQTAARMVDQATPLDATAATTIVRVHDRRSWAAANTESLAYLAEPVAEKLAAGDGAGSPLAMLGPALLGMQAGSTIGFLSQRVFGRFDAGLPSGSPDGASFVVPNIEAFAADRELDPRQVRLWVALHEVTHQAELAVPWVRERMAMLAHEFTEGLEIDPDSLQRRFELLQDPEELQRALEEPGGMGMMFRSDPDSKPAGAIRALIAFLDGYAEHVAATVGSHLVPQAARIREAVDRHRAEPADGESMLQELIGLSLDPALYRQGLEFVTEVERRWGAEAMATVWTGPDAVPTLAELGDPVGWAARVLL